jgi:glycosyltransferase involved in cell wall biosynthesis
VLDEAERIGGLLAACRRWRSKAWRSMVVDGGSRDGTPGLCAGLADQVIASARGRAAQMNTGAAPAMATSFSSPRRHHAAGGRTVGASRRRSPAGADWGRFDVRIDGTPPLLRVVERMMNWRSRLTGIATGDQAIFVRRATLRCCIGGYPATSP